jgi:hypothetical protein
MRKRYFLYKSNTVGQNELFISSRERLKSSLMQMNFPYVPRTAGFLRDVFHVVSVNIGLNLENNKMEDLTGRKK